MDITVLKVLLWEFSLKSQESEGGMLHCLFSPTSKSTFEDWPCTFLLFFHVPFKTNGKFWASKNIELGPFLFH